MLFWPWQSHGRWSIWAIHFELDIVVTIMHDQDCQLVFIPYACCNEIWNFDMAIKFFQIQIYFDHLTTVKFKSRQWSWSIFNFKFVHGYGQNFWPFVLTMTPWPWALPNGNYILVRLTPAPNHNKCYEGNWIKTLSPREP